MSFSVPRSSQCINEILNIVSYNLSQCNKGQARAQNFFSPISINLVPKVASNCE